MNDSQTKNAALSITRAFHYQVLIGIKQFFTLQEDQSIWFERDGDVSLRGGVVEDAKQIEVKQYADTLGDNHENFWKTLKNWLVDEFNHEIYGSLVLHTTQPFGATTSLKGWNDCSPEQRLSILQAIFNKRSFKELTADPLKNIVVLQKKVMETEENKLKAVLEKVVLFTEAEDETSTRESIIARFTGIPNNNKNSYLRGLIGFVYDEADSTHWEISKAAFDAKLEELTATYCRKEFTFPRFEGIEATEEDVAQYEDALFVRKIRDIEHHEVVPDAVGNWIELNNSLNEQLDEYPIYRQKTLEYQKKLIKRFKSLFSTAKLKCTDSLHDSKIFYNEIICDLPINMDAITPPTEYKNGLIHDAMDDSELDLKWNVENYDQFS